MHAILPILSKILILIGGKIINSKISTHDLHFHSLHAVCLSIYVVLPDLCSAELRFVFFRMLVYEFVDNGNLEQWLHGDVGPCSPLTWEIRMNIVLGTAKGYIF